MSKTIQQKLKDSLILDENEPILSFIQVADYLKHQQQFKKISKEELSNILTANKTYFLLASIRSTNNDSTPMIYLVKLNEKSGEFKLKLTWNLSEVKTVTKLDEKAQYKNSNGQMAVNELSVFELCFLNESNSDTNNSQNEYRKYLWLCDKIQDRDDFLSTLWKLSEQFLKSVERPKFINYQIEKEKKLSTNTNDNQENNKETNNTDLSNTYNNQNNQQNFELSNTDEESLLKLMLECDFASSNAENFIEKLQTELVYLDTSNIESIMNSEKNTMKLIDMLDQAVEEIEKIDVRLKEYEDKISAVGDAVRVVGERDNVIQLQQNNQHALLDLLDCMMSALEFSEENKKILNDCDLKSQRNIEKCINAGHLLCDILDADMPLGLKKMKAYEEQVKYLEYLKMRFCTNASTYLKNAIGHSTNVHFESYKIVDHSLNVLPSHKQIHDDLIIFKDLMPWVYRSRCSFNDHDQIRKSYYDDIRFTYVDTVKQLYLRELIPFCNCARAKIVKHERPKATGSMENLKGSFIRPFDKSHGGELFHVRIDQQTKELLKAVFIKLLNHISLNVQQEQLFCNEFFQTKRKENLKQEQDTISNSTNSNQQQHNQSQLSRNASFASSNSSNTTNLNKPHNDVAILKDIFGNSIEDQIKLIIDSILKTENLMVIFVYSDLLLRVLNSHNNKEYMHQPLVSLLRTGKERCDEFVNHLKDSIREYKVNKREKIGIIKYVSYFEEFVKEAEICWDPIRKEMYEKLCMIYQQIVNEIFKGIDQIASESQKTPPEVVRFQNFQHMNHIMRSINGLKDSTKYSRDQYLSSKQSYVKEYFGRPLEKLHSFFEKVDAKIERGYKHEDISYQLDLSANNLREIIKEYPAREVKKGLDNLYNKVEKHLVENSSLLNVVWVDMSNEFIKQYKNYENLIQKCYPGQRISLEFTEEDICKFFQDIAQSH